MPIMNDVELNAIILSDLNGIIDEVMRWFYDPNTQTGRIIDYMNMKIFNANFPNVYDRRSDHGDGLLQSFDKKNTATVGQVVTGEVKHEPDLMYQHESGNPEDFWHGSEYWQKMDDVRDILIDIIIGGKSGNLFGMGFWRFPRDFWSPVEELLQNGSVDDQIELAFNRRGIVWRRV